MKSIIKFFKDRIVFSVSLVLALISCFFVKPSVEYLSYIDVNTLCILFALMATIQGLNGCGVFRKLGQFLCSKCHSVKSLSAILVMLCFFTSMFITNDVALLTFVPFAIVLFNEIDGTPSWVTMFTVILMTVAANTGSMLTPVGNPQNLFIYEKSGMGLGQFILVLLPYTGICLFMLIASGLFIPGSGIRFKGKVSGTDGNSNGSKGAVVYPVGKDADKEALDAKVAMDANCKRGTLDAKSEKGAFNKKSTPVANCKRGAFMSEESKKVLLLCLYSALFILSLLSVCRIIPKTVAAAVTLISLLIFNRKTLLKVDYILLLTFVCFFVFSGNLSNIHSVRNFLQSVLNGRECLTGALASQVVSNVPATLMLYPFTQNVSELLLGVNFGGLGTLVGSLASLISFNIYSQESRRLGGAGENGVKDKESGVYSGTSERATCERSAISDVSMEAARKNNVVSETSEGATKESLPSQGKYLLYFTVINVIYILILFGAKALISLI